ncbi:MAG: DNA gyrase inhibitor YacG [Nitrosomonas sp.]|nr:DNA gyrase inhibitor YacG [Nitrosomonas sp.]MCC7136316.1 DNA gyrase inhibitor YacG [Nitrosomonas sp.]
MEIPQKRVSIANCPQCGDAVAWIASNRFRPFCSERCKVLDLGQWASEGYRLPSDVQIEEDIQE